jgi:DNA-binding LytR/AlgR family response regulator
VLIVDDEVLISEQLSVILEEIGYQVTIAFDTESAINSLKTNQQELAILDIKMHGKNQGFAIAKYIRENMNIPFIFLTSFADSTTVDEASKFMPAAYILKPFNEANIYSTLKIVFNNHAINNIFFTIKVGHEVFKVKEDDLLYIMSSDKYIEIYTKTQMYLKRDSIDTFIQDNNLTGIIRIHRSYVVKLSNIDSVKGKTIYFKDKELKISNTYMEDFNNAFNRKD